MREYFAICEKCHRRWELIDESPDIAVQIDFRNMTVGTTIQTRSIEVCQSCAADVYADINRYASEPAVPSADATSSEVPSTVL